MAKPQKKKYLNVSLNIPQDVLDFYRKVAKRTNLTVSKVITVVAMIEAIKLIEAKKRAKRS